MYLCILKKTQILHGTGVFANIHHKFKPFMQVDIPYMEHMGMDIGWLLLGELIQISVALEAMVGKGDILPFLLGG